MEKKTIGAFIAALRKANGMTQQELADKLNVSNKAVSRWERDECAPDITLVPALAEILGVTCDELLKGERILSEEQQEKSEPKVEKQVKALINRAVSKFTILIWVSIALSAMGLVCMFGISYGAFFSIVGFAVMSIFTIAAFVVAAIATTKLKGVKNENELFESADVSLLNRFNKTLGNFSFNAFFGAITVVVLSLPLVIFAPDRYTYLEPESYLICFGVAIFLLGILWIVLKNIYYMWITEQRHKKMDFKLILLNSLQLGTVILAGIFFVICPYYENPKESSTSVILLGLAYALLAASAVTFIIFISICKTDRKKLVFSGFRNMLMVIPSLLLQLCHDSNFITYSQNGILVWLRTDTWHTEFILLALGLTLFILIIFELIKKFINKISTKKSGLAES